MADKKVEYTIECCADCMFVDGDEVVRIDSNGDRGYRDLYRCEHPDLEKPFVVRSIFASPPILCPIRNIKLEVSVTSLCDLDKESLGYHFNRIIRYVEGR